MWSLILLDCQISVTAGSYIQIYISLPLCGCFTPPPIILLLYALPRDEWIYALVCLYVCNYVYVCGGLTAPVHYTVSSQLMCHYTVM